MENTQVIDWDAEEEETEISNGSLGHSLEPIGRLRLFSSAHGPERDFPLYFGKNVVGRSPDCSVTLPFPSISKQHAVIEISAYNKAPILQDCGSLNGTQLVKPPKVLTPGVSHHLKDQELILFADFPCQYRRLDVPPPLVSRGFLTIEGTPRIQGESQTSRVLLAEDSEEEVDFPSGRCVANGSRNPTSPSATVVPESDEEASSPAPRGPGLSLPFDVGSDTDEEQGQQPAVGGASSARAGAAAAEAEQSGVKGMAAGIQLGQAQPTEPKFKDTKVKSEAGNGAAQVGSVLERSLTLGEDSDTDVEGEGVPMTPCVGPGKKKQVLLGVGTGDPGAPVAEHVQGSPASAVEEIRAPVAVPSETNHTPMVIDSDTDEEGEVSAALTLAHLKERGITLWSRDSGMEEVKSQPQVLVERSQSASGRDSDTDVEEGKREMVPDSPMDTESQPPHRARAGGEDIDMNSPGGHLEGNQASSATVDSSATQVEEEVPPEPAVTLGEKHQLPLEEAQPSGEAWEAAVGEDSSSAVADVKKSQQPVAEDAGRECATAVSEAESTLKVGAQSRSPTAPVEQVVVYMGTRGDPTQPQREGAQMGRTKTAKDCSDESDDLCLPATQCFVERESQSSEAQSLEDEPTQGFPSTLPQEPGPSHLSLQTPGAGALDVPWEVLATQPFCLREPEASEPQLVAAHLEAHGSPPSLPSASPGHQHLVHTEQSGVQGREIQTMEKAMGIPKETADRVTPEREPLERKVRERASDSEREDVMGEELPQVTEDREPKTVLARDGQGQESNKGKGGDPEGNRESLKVEMEMSKDTQKREREVGKPEPESEWEPAGLEVNLDRGVAEGGSHDQKEQTASPTLKPGSQGDGGKGDPVSSGRQQRGLLSCKMMSAGKASGGDPEPPAHCLLSPVPEASAPPQSLLASQSPKQSRPPPSMSSPSEPHLPESLHTEPHVRPRRSSRMTPSSSAALKPYTACPTDLPAAPRSTSRVTRSRANKSSARTPEVIVPIDSELQPPTSTEQPSIPRPTSQVTQGSTDSSFDKTPESVLTGPEIQPPTTEQPVTPNPTPRATQGRPSRSSIKTPELNVPTSSELQPPTSTEQAVIPKPTSRATRGRARKSPIRTPEPVVPTVSEIQPPTSTEQAVIPKPTSRATRGRARKSPIRTPEPVVPTVSEIQPPTSTEQAVIPKPTSRATRGRARKSPIRTPEPVVPTVSEIQPPTSTEQAVIPKPTSRATRGRARKSPIRTPEPVVPTVSEIQPPTSTEQAVIPKPTSRATWGRPRKSVRTPEPVVPTGPELQPVISTEEPVTPELSSQSSQGRSRKSIRTPVVPTGPEFQPAISTEQPVTPELSSQGRARRSCVRTEASISTAPELKPSTSRKPPSPKPTALGTRGRTCKPSLEESKSVEPVAPNFDPPISTDHLTPEVTDQSITLKSSPLSASTVSTTPGLEPGPPEPVPQGSRRRRRKAAGKQGSHIVPVDHEPHSAPSEPESQSSTNQSSGTLEEAECITVAPEAAIAQVPETHPHIPLMQKEAAGQSGLTPKPQPEASRVHKEPSTTTDSPLQKRPRRQVPQMTIIPKEEDPPETPVKEEPQERAIPVPGKRKRGRAEDETQGNPSRSRRAKPNQEAVAPKVLFTGVVDSRGERAVLALGGSLASSVNEASHLVTDRICRTVKFLCALGKGIPILSLNWLYQSRKAGHFLPPDDYLVTDPEQEKNFSFSLRDALSRARERKLLEGYEIHVTPRVQPPPAQMAEIIGCCGGTVLPSMPHSYKPQRVVVTCTEDLPCCAVPTRLGLPLLSSEFLLTGVLKQEATPEAFVLSNLEMLSS